MELSKEQTAESVLAHLPDPIVALGPDARLLWANRRAEERFGWSAAELMDQALDELVHPDDVATALASLVSVGTKRVGSLVEIRIRDRSGTYAWYEIRGARWTDGPVEGAIVIDLREMTDRRRWEMSAGNTQMLGVVLDAAPTINVIVASDGTIRGASRALTRHLRRPLEGTLGTSLLDIVEPDDRPVVATLLATADGTTGTRTVEARLLASDGRAVPMSLTVVDLLSDEAVNGILVAASDISALDQVRADLHHLANHDGLTGLPNRLLLRERLDRLLAVDSTQGHALVFGDVDGLKAVNDKHGHRAGDTVLAEIGRRLASVMRDGDFVARLSGDEFVVVVPSPDDKVIADLEDRIGRALEPPIVLPSGRKLTIGMSLGAAHARPGMDAEDLLAAADAAMYVAKRKRREIR